MDQVTREPIGFASVTILNTPSLPGTASDSSGHFIFKNVPVGRYDLQVSGTGYRPAIFPEVMVGSGREVFLSVELTPELKQLREVVITPEISKERPLNTNASVSARMLSVEEARRFAGGFDDPARLVASFAGVSGNIGNNALIIRGNSPQSLQWKLEGVEIPSPNHLGDMRSFGGGTVTALSSQLLADSDFFSGAMPAEYSNALSGVFDIFMRSGNNQKHEHTFQLGVVGIDAASEGPFKKGGKSSYLFNYRYSTLALVAPLLADNAGGIKYQDLSFKLHFPTLKAGTFSVWGMGLKDRLGAEAKQNREQWIYDNDLENHKPEMYTAVAGLSHTKRLGTRQYLRSALATTWNGIHYLTERLDTNLQIHPKTLLDNHHRHIVLSSSLQTRFSTRYVNKTGFTMTHMNYRLLLQNDFRSSSVKKYVAHARGHSTLLSAYTHFTLTPAEKTTLNTGLNVQLFTLNNSLSAEPRAGLKHRLSGKQSLSLAYGLHSRLERLHYYFNSGETVNSKMKPTKAHHWVAGYAIRTSAFTHLKTEVYYQYLFDVPVIKDSSFSLLNQENEWFLDAPLQNTGAGKNYGIDITFEKYLSGGYYYNINASVFRSRYKGGDAVWRNTRYNRGYTFNFLAGKEWQNRQNVWGINTRLSYQGGNRYSPVNTAASEAQQSAVFDETRAFSLRYPPAFTTYLTLSYKINQKKAAHEIALKVINLTQYKEYVGFRYNYRDKTVDVNREPLVIPNLSYRIDL